MIRPTGKTPRPWWRPLKRRVLRSLPRRRHLVNGWLHRYLGNRLFDPGLWKPSAETAARGMAVGTFVGLMPFIGMQILVSVVLCYWLRINITAAIMATFITNPFTTPMLVPLQFKLGQWLIHPWKHLNEVSTHGVNHYLVEYGLPFVAGAFVSSVVAALLAYPLTHWAWRGITKIAKAKNQSPQIPME